MSAQAVLRMFAVSFLVTVLVEEGAAALAGVRGRRGALLIFLVNLLTNPAAVLLVFGLGLFAPQRIPPGFARHLMELPVEAAVVLAEGAVFRACSGRGVPVIRRPFRLSLFLNALSYISGVLLTEGSRYLGGPG